MTLRVAHLRPGDDISPAFEVRQRVFQQEQGISAEADFDGLDHQAEQFVAYEDDLAVGTGRYRIVEDKVGKVERVAVLGEYRGRKVGGAIMEIIAETAKEQGLGKLVLDAQLSASKFYENLGYKTDGEVFEEVGIPHVVMSLDLNKE